MAKTSREIIAVKQMSAIEYEEKGSYIHKLFNDEPNYKGLFPKISSLTRKLEDARLFEPNEAKKVLVWFKLKKKKVNEVFLEEHKVLVR